MRGTPGPATLDEAYLQASTWRVQAPRKRDGESESTVYVIADTLRKEIESSTVRKEDPRQRGYYKVLRVLENRASGEGLSGYQEVEEGRTQGTLVGTMFLIKRC